MRSSKRKSNSKWYLLFSILTLSVLTAFIFTSSVFSSSELNMKIVFGSETWDLSEESSFDKEWVTNRDSISFKVDLSSYYSKLADGETGEQPFDVQSSYKKEAITVQKVKDDSGVFNGIYNVSVDTNAMTDGEVDFQLNINGTNNWEIPADKNPIEFSVKKDTTEPVINYSGIDDQAVYHAEYPEITVELEDDLQNKFIKLNDKDITSTFEWNKNVGKLKFTKDGAYRLKITAVDKAGNTSTEDLMFYVHKEAPVWKITSSGKEVNNGDFIGTNTVDITIENGIDIESVSIIHNNNKLEDTIDISGSTAKLEAFEFKKDGSHHLKAIVKDQQGNGEHEIEFKLTVDQEAPHINMTVDNDSDFINNHVYQENFELSFDIIEPNLNREKSSIKLIKEVHSGKQEEIDILSNYNGQDIPSYNVNEDGHYIIKGKLVDQSGNVTNVNQEFTLFEDSDLISVKDQNNKDLKIYNSNNLTLHINYWNFDRIENSYTVEKLNEATGKKELLYNNVNNFGYLYWVIQTFGDEGKYFLTIKANPLFGSDIVKNYEFVVDKTDPDAVLNTPITDKQHVSQTFIEKHGGFSNLFDIRVEDKYLDSSKVQIKYTDLEGNEVIYNDEKAGSWKESDNGKSFDLKEEQLKLEGQYTITIEAKDKSGRNTKKSVSYVYDKTKPIIEMSDVKSYITKNHTQVVTVKEHNYENNDVDISILKHNEDGTTESCFKEAECSDKEFIEWKNEKYETSAEYTFNKEGKYEVTVIAEDAAGNKTEEEVTFTLDKNAPEITISGVDNNEHSNKSELVEVKVEDNNLNKEAIRLSVNKWNDNKRNFEKIDIDTTFVFGKKSAKWEYEFGLEGTFEILLSSVDKAGSMSEQRIEFTIDKSAPQVAVKNLNKKYYDGDHTITFQVDEINYLENNVSFTVKRNEKDITHSEIEKQNKDWKNEKKVSTLTHTFKKNGKYDIALHATDKAGNVSQIINQSFIIDKEKPEINIVGVKDGEFPDESRKVSLSIEDVNLKDYKIMLDDIKLKPEDVVQEGNKIIYNHTYTDDGDYEIYISAIDHSGNRSEEKVNFTIDKIEPKISVGYKLKDKYVTWDKIESMIDDDEEYISDLIPVEVTERNIKKKTVTVTVIDDNGDKKTYPDEKAGNKEPGKWEEMASGQYNYKLYKDIFSENGDYTITVEVDDKALHSGKKSISFTVDNDKPIIELSKLDDYSNKKSQTEVVAIKEHNFSARDVEVNILRENAQGNFVKYRDASKNWGKTELNERKQAYRFSEDGTYKVEVTAIDKAGNEADKQVDIFTIDTMNPKISISGVTDKQHYRTSKKAKVDVDDANVSQKKTELKVYKLNYSTGKMEAYNTGKAPIFSRRTMDWEYNFTSEGTYRVQIKSTDMAGNKGETQTVDFTVDKTAPALAINNVKDGQYYNNGRSAEFTIEETNFARNTVQFQVTKDGQDITNAVEGNRGASWRTSNFLSKLRYSFSQDGAYHVRMNATDDAGNKARTAQKGFVIDTKKPVIDITGVEDGEYYNTDVPVGVTIKDVNFDLNTIRVTRNGQNYPVGGFAITNNRYQNSIASFAHRFTQEGDYEIFVESVDKANNGDTATLSFTIDKTKPVITPMMGGDNKELVDGSYINHVFQPIFQLDNEEDKIVSVRLNNGGNIAGNVPLASKEMKYGYEVIAQDKAGNETTLNVGFTLDTTKPKLSITGIIEGFFNKDIRPQVEYSDKHLDEKRTSITLNGAAFKNGLQLTEERDYVLKALITDLADNVSERTIVFTIDKTAPKIVFNEEISGKYLNDVVIPELLIDDMTAYDIIALTLNGEPYELGDPIESEGKHVLYFEVRDQAGNIQQLTIEFIIDQTEPEVIFDGAEENKEYVEAVDLSIQLDNPQDKIKSITVNGEAYDGDVSEQDGNEVVQYHFSEINKYNVEVTAYDEAGNEVTRSLPFEITEKSVLTKFYENKPLFSVSIAGVAALLLAILFALVRSRKGKKAAEE